MESVPSNSCQQELKSNSSDLLNPYNLNNDSHPMIKSFSVFCKEQKNEEKINDSSSLLNKSPNKLLPINLNNDSHPMIKSLSDFCKGPKNEEEINNFSDKLNKSPNKLPNNLINNSSNQLIKEEEIKKGWIKRQYFNKFN